MQPAAVAQSPVNGATTFVHDPSTIIKEGDRYYMYATGAGILTKVSFDKFRWFDGPRVFATPPAWTTAAVPGFTNDFWAPEISYFNSTYHLYYSVSTFGSRVSAIGMATNTTLNPSDPAYGWVDQGLIIQSNNSTPYNTIDPAIFRQSNGNMWMIYGSYWEGIHSVQLNTTTGKRLSNVLPTYRLADREPGIEAAYMVERDGMFYLFTNWGTCCAGVSSTYNIRVGRSNSPTGPFVDKNGVQLVNGGGSLFLGPTGRYIGPGHTGIFTEDGQQWLGFHYYDGLNAGARTYDVRPLAWDSQGWPVVGAFPAGDYNGDLVTDAADFLVWQRTLGQREGPADGNDDRNTDAGDLAVWRNGFGAGTLSVVPEPTALALAASGIALAAACRRMRAPRSA